MAISEVAQNILDVLKHGQNKILLICWGARDFVAAEDYLKFKVSGQKFKGYVRIIYNPGPDLYTIEFAKIQKHTWTVKKTYEGVYFDQLVELIDGYVETDR